MSGRQSATVTRAVRMVEKGTTPYAAAKQAGIAMSTIYRALGPNNLAVLSNRIAEAEARCMFWRAEGDAARKEGKPVKADRCDAKLKVWTARLEKYKARERKLQKA